MRKKAIVIGLDGFEPSIVEELMAVGALPHLASLARQGGWSSLSTTVPAQTPVAWSSMATSTNPGGHGIFDFVRRDPLTYQPTVSLFRYEQKRAYLPPRAVNLRGGETLWDVLTAAGVPSAIIRFPCTYPPSDLRGRMLSGLGVPDLRGSFGTPSFYTSAEDEPSRENEVVVGARPDASGMVRTHLVGPHGSQPYDITVHVRPQARTATVTSAGQPSQLHLREGEWSEWLHVKFKTGLLTSVRGMLRFYLVACEPLFELYASPANFDPESPWFPISAPAEYARDLAGQMGTFYTSGMAEDHVGLNNGRLSESAFLEQCRGVMREREKMMACELERLQEGLFFCLFDTPDRVQHMFWHEGREVIREHYRECDRIVGQALAAADADTLCMVLSDHGMGSFKRGVHINGWLRDNGYLTLGKGDGGEYFRDVDWSRTRAYALGFGSIYMNLRGREGRGIVDIADAPALKSAIADGLRGLVDPVGGQSAVRRVLPCESIYSGPYVDQAPDLVVNFAADYRASWATALGGVPGGLFEDNDRKWCGDHIMDPCLVPGVLFANQALASSSPDIIDVTPTILQFLGVERGAAMEGRSLLTS